MKQFARHSNKATRYHGCAFNNNKFIQWPLFQDNLI